MYYCITVGECYCIIVSCTTMIESRNLYRLYSHRLYIQPRWTLILGQSVQVKCCISIRIYADRPLFQQYSVQWDSKFLLKSICQAESTVKPFWQILVNLDLHSSLRTMYKSKACEMFFHNALCLGATEITFTPFTCLKFWNYTYNKISKFLIAIL